MGQPARQSSKSDGKRGSNSKQAVWEGTVNAHMVTQKSDRQRELISSTEDFRISSPIELVISSSIAVSAIVI